MREQTSPASLNQVDTNKAARYGSGEVEYYMGRRGSYFKN